MPVFLVVDDNSLMRKTLANTFKTSFPCAKIHEAVNGKEALDSFEHIHPDLIVMDIELPDSNGLDLTRRIKMRDPTTQVLVFSLYDTLEYREAAARNGADGFFSKRTDSSEEIVRAIHART